MDNFNLKKYLVENKRTTNSKILSEAQDQLRTDAPYKMAQVINNFIVQRYKEGVEEFEADEKEFGPNQHFGKEDMTHDLVPEDWQGEDLWVVTDGDRGGWDISVQVYDEDDDEPDEDFVIMSVVDGVIYDEYGKPYTPTSINELSEIEKAVSAFSMEAMVKSNVSITTGYVSKFVVVYDYDESNTKEALAFRPDMKSAEDAKNRLEKTDMFTGKNLRIQKIN